MAEFFSEMAGGRDAGLILSGTHNLAEKLKSGVNHANKRKKIFSWFILPSFLQVPGSKISEIYFLMLHLDDDSVSLRFFIKLTPIL